MKLDYFKPIFHFNSILSTNTLNSLQPKTAKHSNKQKIDLHRIKQKSVDGQTHHCTKNEVFH